MSQATYCPLIRQSTVQQCLSNNSQLLCHRSNRSTLCTREGQPTCKSIKPCSNSRHEAVSNLYHQPHRIQCKLACTRNHCFTTLVSTIDPSALPPHRMQCSLTYRHRTNTDKHCFTILFSTIAPSLHVSSLVVLTSLTKYSNLSSYESQKGLPPLIADHIYLLPLLYYLTSLN
jgi:hypothetical protein